MNRDTSNMRDKLHNSTAYFRENMTKAGFDITPGTHPIVPVMLYEAQLAQDFAEKLLEKGIYVIGFYYPVGRKGKARIRVQISAVHRKEHHDKEKESITETG